MSECPFPRRYVSLDAIRDAIAEQNQRGVDWHATHTTPDHCHLCASAVVAHPAAS